MNTCLLISSDLIFATRITGAAENFRVPCAVVHDPDKLQEALGSNVPSVVLVDMNCDGIAADEAIRMVKTKYPGVRVVAYYPHVQTELAEKAVAAAADDVWPRSAFVRRLPELFEF